MNRQVIFILALTYYCNAQTQTDVREILVDDLTFKSEITNIRQNFKSLKGKDTVYFYFDYSKQLEKRYVSRNIKTNDSIYVYTFHENKPNQKIQRKFHLFKSKYLSFDDMDNNKQADVRTVSKRFLRKNKEIVIKPKDLKRYKMEKVHGSIYRSPIFYIIDIKEKKGRKYIVREVRHNSGSFLEL